MARAKLGRLLLDWFRDEVEASPPGDPRRSPACLRFEEVSTVVEEHRELPPARAAHVRDCQWCQSTLNAYRAIDLAARPTPGQGPGTGVDISMRIEGRWPAELRDCLRRWLKRMARQEAEGVPAAAHFDDEGTLHVRWRGLEVEGPVTISLMWEGAEVPLARGVVKRGTLQVSEPLPGLGVRNVEISQRLLRVRQEKST